jgi:subtilisin family serine protease
MRDLELVRLSPLMEKTAGRPEIIVGLIDGPVLLTGDLWSKRIVQSNTNALPSQCTHPSSDACMHGTFVASLLAAKRGSGIPAICPDCTVVVYSIFSEPPTGDEQMPSASPEQLATAIFDTVGAGARVLNMSVGLSQPAGKGDDRLLREAFDYAARRGVVPVAASGNQGSVGSSSLTNHPWVLPVVGCDGQGRPTPESNLGGSIGRGGLSAPATGVFGLGPDGRSRTIGGTSVAAPFVTGTIALLWSEFPNATASEVKYAVTASSVGRRTSIVPPLLNAWGAYEALASAAAHRN